MAKSNTGRSWSGLLAIAFVVLATLAGTAPRAGATSITFTPPDNFTDTINLKYDLSPRDELTWDTDSAGPPEGRFLPVSFMSHDGVGKFIGLTDVSPGNRSGFTRGFGSNCKFNGDCAFFDAKSTAVTSVAEWPSLLTLGAFFFTIVVQFVFVGVRSWRRQMT